jgi:hypothetical protein
MLFAKVQERVNESGRAFDAIVGGGCVGGGTGALLDDIFGEGALQDFAKPRFGALVAPRRQCGRVALLDEALLG